MRRHGYIRYYRQRVPLLTPTQKGHILLTLLLLGLLALIIQASSFLKQLSREIALSDAIDLTTITINETIHRKMAESNFDDNYFVSFEKDNEGNITAISTNMARVNSFSSEVLSEIVRSCANGELNIRVPVGNLMGSNILLGKGPEVPVDIIMLTSSYTDFRNELVSAGINQTKHQIILEVVVDIDVLLPWETSNTRVVSETLIAETVVVGRVPETYVNTE